MNNEELKNALINKKEVTFNGSTYTVTGILYRATKGKINVSVELLDKNKKSIIYAMPERVEVI